MQIKTLEFAVNAISYETTLINSYLPFLIFLFSMTTLLKLGVCSVLLCTPKWRSIVQVHVMTITCDCGARNDSFLNRNDEGEFVVGKQKAEYSYIVISRV